MPAKNSIGDFHGRYHLISKDLWKQYQKTANTPVTYEEFKDIVASSMQEIQKWVLKEPIGFQLPNLGNIAVNMFKPNREFKAYINTSQGPVINHNLHTGGNVYSIRWFNSSTAHKSKQPFWFFKAERKFNRALASVLKGDKSPVFNSFMQDHFITKALKQCKY